MEAIKETLGTEMNAAQIAEYATPDSVTDNLKHLLKNPLENCGDALAWNAIPVVLRPGVYVLTGIPNMGKSTLLDNIIVNSVNKHGYKWAIFSPESLPLESHLQQLIEIHTKTNFTGKYKSCQTSEFDIDRFIDDHKKSLFFLKPDENKLSIEYILSLIEYLVKEHGVNAFVLDPYNEFSHTRPPHLSETEYVSQFLGAMRKFTREHKVCGWVVAHPTKMKKEEATRMDGTKGMEYPIPDGYSISGSANFNNKADVLMAYHRDRDIGRNPDNLCIVKVWKTRKGFGECGEYYLKFDYRNATFTSAN